MNPPCTVEGCTRRARSRTATLCAAHYHRLWRNGTLGDDTTVKEPGRTLCVVADCTRARASRDGYCWTHARRMRKHGTTDLVEVVRPSGPDNPAWRGDDVGYTGAHDRVRRVRGSARKQACIDCGGQARHWSYDHNDQNELFTEKGYAYSADPAFYVARCVPCHKRFDLAKIAAHPLVGAS